MEKRLLRIRGLMTPVFFAKNRAMTDNMLHKLMVHKFKIIFAVVLIMALSGVVAMNGQPVASQEEEPASMWSVRCNDGENGHCEIFQRLIVRETGQRVVEFAIGFPEKGQPARGVMILPLGVLLTEGVKMKVDDGQVFSFQVRFCSPDGCFAYVNLNDDLLGLMGSGDTARISFQNPSGETMNVDLPLVGFDKSLQEIS